jgi:hypothetical protein
MEKFQLERREKIAAALVLAGIGASAIRARKDGITGIARLYPGGWVFADALRDGMETASARLSFRIRKTEPLDFEFGDAELTETELKDIEDAFGDGDSTD